MISELILKIGDQQTASGLGFEDGDVICAFNRRRIRQVHAEGICHVRRAPRNGSGLIRLDAVIRDWYEATHQYRNERVSRTEVLRTEIATGTQEVFSDKPNKKGERIDDQLRGDTPVPVPGDPAVRKYPYGNRQSRSRALL